MGPGLPKGDHEDVIYFASPLKLVDTSSDRALLIIDLVIDGWVHSDSESDTAEDDPDESVSTRCMGGNICNLTSNLSVFSSIVLKNKKQLVPFKEKMTYLCYSVDADKMNVMSQNNCWASLSEPFLNITSSLRLSHSMQ